MDIRENTTTALVAFDGRCRELVHAQMRFRDAFSRMISAVSDWDEHHRLLDVIHRHSTALPASDYLDCTLKQS